MPLLFKLTVFSVFLIAALVVNSEEKDLKADASAVTKRESKGHGSFHHHGDHKIKADDLQTHHKGKKHANQTATIVKHGRTNGIRYRSKWLRNPYADEDTSGYYRQRRRPNNDDYDNDYPDSRPNRGNGGRRRSNKKRGRGFGRNFQNSCQECGKMLKKNYGQGPNNFGRVIDGRVVQPPFKYPWIVSLSKPPVGLYCGGAIISATFILTAGHCVIDVQKVEAGQCDTPAGTTAEHCFYKPNEIRLSLLGRQAGERGQRPVGIAKIIWHPQFNLKKVLHDVALIQLGQPIQCNQFASPICLPESDLNKMGGVLVIAGWGYNTGEGHEGPKMLREGTVKQIKPDVCKENIDNFNNDLNDVVCAIGTESKQSSCKGDSGSSVFAKFKNKVYTLGVSSRHSKEDCQVDMPVVYAKTFRYMKFIKYYVKDLPGSKGSYWG